MDYQAIVSSAPKVLVEFFASWCPHCHRMMPVVASVKEEGKAAVFQYDVDRYPTLADKNKVVAYPTFILYRNGQEVWRSVGEMPGSELRRALAGN